MRRREFIKTFGSTRAAPVFALLMLAAIDSAAQSQTVDSTVYDQKLYGALSQRPPAVLSIADCDGSVRQRFGIEELDPVHRVRVHGGAGACIQAHAAADGAAVTLQPCSSLVAGQIFDLDGDSILLDSNPDLVVQLKNSVTQAGTPVTLGRRLLSDVEFWDIASIDNPPRSPTSGFMTVSDGAARRLPSPPPDQTR